MWFDYTSRNEEDSLEAVIANQLCDNPKRVYNDYLDYLAYLESIIVIEPEVEEEASTEELILEVE